MTGPAQGSADGGTGRQRASGRGGKSAAAFRTISEVAGELDVAQHVLRFWESKFPQVRPLKRGGGRRYYRPEDIELLRQIRALLYEEGYTIKGAQKLLRTQRRPGAINDAGPDNGADPPAAGTDAHAVGNLSRDARTRLAQVRDELIELRERLRDALG